MSTGLSALTLNGLKLTRLIRQLHPQYFQILRHPDGTILIHLIHQNRSSIIFACMEMSLSEINSSFSLYMLIYWNWSILRNLQILWAVTYIGNLFKKAFIVLFSLDWKLNYGMARIIPGLPKYATYSLLLLLAQVRRV